MTSAPLALIPCRVALWIAANLLPASSRDKWKQEWLAELWYEWLHFRSPRHLYRCCLGCFPDAWCQALEDRHDTILLAVRSPRSCLAFLSFLSLIVAFSSGLFAATRKILSPLPYSDAAKIAIVSRTGRLEGIRRGIPRGLAMQWRQESPLIQSMALCSFPFSVRVKTGQDAARVLSVRASANLFQVLGTTLIAGTDAGSGSLPRIAVSTAFWKRHFYGRVLSRTSQIEIEGKLHSIAGVVPPSLWFLSPAVEVIELTDHKLPPESMLIVKSRFVVPAQVLEHDLIRTAKSVGFEFTRTAPHALLLRDAVRTPLWLFASALLIALVLATVAYGARWAHGETGAVPLRKADWRWWAFFFGKTGLALLLVFVTGLEVCVGPNQSVSQALGGPVLIWFYIAGCTLALFVSIADQRARCRVCQRILAFPIRIGCPGCLFLNWAGTELLCPRGHGALYVPHHATCWEQEDRWVLLEV